LAIIKEMVGKKIIDGFKGKLDFYYQNGLCICRSWPRNQGTSQTPASVAQQPMFTYVARLWSQASPFVMQAYDDMAHACGLHKKDWFTRGYYGKIYRYPTDEHPT